VALVAGLPPVEPGPASFAAARQARIDALADALEDHLDLDRLLDLVASGPPVTPVLRGGLA
jgi:adenosylcobyric acid synthase